MSQDFVMAFNMVLAVIIVLMLLTYLIFAIYSQWKDNKNWMRYFEELEDERLGDTARADTIELPAFPKEAHKTRAIPRAMPTRAVERLLRDLGQ